MKKLIGTALGLLLVLSFVNASTVLVNTAKTGTQEFFGVAKNIKPTGIGIVLGATYIANDTLTFTLPSTYKFETPAAKYFLVLTTTVTGVYDADADGNGTNDWGYLSGEGINELQFRLVDGATSANFTSGKRWFLATEASTVAWAGSNQAILIEVPAGPTATSTTKATDSKLSAKGQVGGVGSYFDIGSGVAFFSAYLEYEIDSDDIAAAEDTIDVEQERKKFTPTGTVTSSGSITINQTNRDYYTANKLTATDYFKHTITGAPAGNPMQGVKYVQCFGTSNNTPVGDVMTVNVPGNYLHAGAWGIGTNRIAVTGTIALSNRVNTVAIEFAPSSNFHARILRPATTAWTWSTNGTLFRTSWFATARNAGYISAIRLANNTTLDAKVYADVYLDDGQKTPESQYVGLVPKNGMWAMDAYALCVAAGLTPDADALGPSSKGRIFLTVWSLPTETFGHLIYTTPLGTTQMPLEKWTKMVGNSWWEK